MAPMFAIQQQAVCGRIKGEGDRGSQPLRLLMSLSLVDRTVNDWDGMFSRSPCGLAHFCGVRGEQVINA